MATRPELTGHTYRVFVTNQLDELYSWRCSCGAEGDRDYLHREYARDGWREHHDLAPQINRPLV